MSYTDNKAKGRSTRTIEKPELSPAKSRQELATGSDEVNMPQPVSSPTRSLGRQLRVAPIKDKLHGALNDYSSANLGNCNQDPNLDGHQPSGRNVRSPKRNVGVGKP